MPLGYVIYTYLLFTPKPFGLSVAWYIPTFSSSHPEKPDIERLMGYQISSVNKKHQVPISCTKNASYSSNSCFPQKTSIMLHTSFIFSPV